MKKILLLILTFITSSYIPTPRCKNGEQFKKSNLVVLAVAKSITYKDVKTQKEDHIERHFYAHFDIIKTFKGAQHKTEVSFHIGKQDRYKKQYSKATKFNSHPIYNVSIGEEYLLELIKVKNSYEPIAYWGSFLKVTRAIFREPINDEVEFKQINKEPYLNYLEKNIPLSEYNKQRKIKLEL